MRCAAGPCAFSSTCSCSSTRQPKPRAAAGSTRFLDCRREIDLRLSATLKRDLTRQRPRLYAKARQRAVLDMEPSEGSVTAGLPTDCPYTLDQILGEEVARP